MSLEYIRSKLSLPKNISEYFYFITHGEREEIDRESEGNFFATKLYF
jgi:hypothetical protein